MTKKRTAMNAVSIINSWYGTEPGWKDILEEERQRRTLGDLLREARRSRGWTQSQLAKKVGTSQAAISRIEDADYEGLKIGTLGKIAQALEQPLAISLGKKRIRLDRGWIRSR